MTERREVIIRLSVLGPGAASPLDASRRGPDGMDRGEVAP
jgi:hypothetical protein